MPEPNEMSKRIKEALAVMDGQIVLHELTPSALRGLCALALCELVGTVATMREQESGLEDYIPRIDVRGAEYALMITNREDYEAASEWLIATIKGTENLGREEATTTDP